MTAILQIPIRIIEPRRWTKVYGLHSKDKDSSRQCALQLFPVAHELLALKQHHNRAEAVLISLPTTGFRVSEKTKPPVNLRRNISEAQLRTNIVRGLPSGLPMGLQLDATLLDEEGGIRMQS